VRKIVTYELLSLDGVAEEPDEFITVFDAQIRSPASALAERLAGCAVWMTAAGPRTACASGSPKPLITGTSARPLLGVLQRQRDLVGWKLRDAPDEVLGVATTPTGMSLPGLVRHLTNVERSWLRDVFAGQQGLAYDWTEQDPEAEWRVPAGTRMADLLAGYAAESRQCDAVVTAARSLDVVSVQRNMSLRWILLHLIEETARHLGHIDVLREQADGSTGEEPSQ
jgi:uncharacterized damage-inducible protein DinB